MTIPTVPILSPSTLPNLYATELLVGYWRDCEDPLSEASYPAKRAAAERATIAKLHAEGSTGGTTFSGGRKWTGLEYAQHMLERYEAEKEAQKALPWPGHHTDPSMPSASRERVAAALNLGEELAAWMGCSFDRLNPERYPMLGSACLGLAGYRWPSGLSHYVLKYGLRLDPVFLSAIGGRGLAAYA